MIDYHVHTSLCNHADGAMDDYIRNAIAAGLSEICFLDHLTLHERGQRLSMTPDMVPLYYQTVRTLGQYYKKDIHVKAGLEVDFDPQNARAVQIIIDPLDFDVIGGSVHFLDQINMVSRKDTEARENEAIDKLCDLYIDRLYQMIETMDLDIVCHLDVFKKFGRRPNGAFETKFDAVLSAIRARNLTVELNTSGLSHKGEEFYPSPGLIKKCHERNIPMTLGSDAHQPDQVGRHFDQALDLLTATGFRHVSAFTRRRRYDLPLTTKTPGIQNIHHGGAP